MKDYRSLVLRTVPNEKLRHTLDEILRKFQQDNALWLDAGLRVGHLDYLIDALKESNKDMDSDREEFKNMLVEFLKYAQETAKNISSSTISASINEQIKEHVGTPMQEVCATTLAEYRTARESEAIWTAQILRRTNTTLIICAIMCIVCLGAGYKWGASSAKEELNSATSQPAAKSSPFVAPFEEKPRQMPAQAKDVPKKKYFAKEGETQDVVLSGTLNIDLPRIGEKGTRVSISQIFYDSKCDDSTAFMIGKRAACSQYIDFK